MTNDNPDLPPALHGQQNVIFGNIVDLHKFHRYALAPPPIFFTSSISNLTTSVCSETFLKELIKYEKLPEDLGHCFVTWAPQFNLYVTYCQNKPTSNEVRKNVKRHLTLLFNLLFSFCVRFWLNKPAIFSIRYKPRKKLTIRLHPTSLSPFNESLNINFSSR